MIETDKNLKIKVHKKIRKTKKMHFNFLQLFVQRNFQMKFPFREENARTLSVREIIDHFYAHIHVLTSQTRYEKINKKSDLEINIKIRRKRRKNACEDSRRTLNNRLIILTQKKFTREFQISRLSLSKFPDKCLKKDVFEKKT